MSYQNHSKRPLRSSSHKVVLLGGAMVFGGVCFADTHGNAGHSQSIMQDGDQLMIPVASQASDKQHIDRPKTGLTGERVVTLYGEPLGITDAIGEPPISRWEYADFFVYFEYDRVIRSVLKHKQSAS